MIHADAKLYSGLLDGAQAASVALDPARKAYVQVLRGSVSVNGQALQTGDAALLSGENAVALSDGHDAEVLVFDLAP
jgi:redox-sensitive bicupin YhaK (pirin superfamily)